MPAGATAFLHCLPTPSCPTPHRLPPQPPPAAQRFHSSSSYVQRVAEDIAFANDTSFRYTRSVPSGAARRALSLAGAPLLLGAAAAGLAELLA